MHIQSIGAVTEQRLWEAGLSDWDAFSDDISIPLSGQRQYFLRKGIEASRHHLYQKTRVIFPSSCRQINPGGFFPRSEIQRHIRILKQPVHSPTGMKQIIPLCYKKVSFT